MEIHGRQNFLEIVFLWFELIRPSKLTAIFFYLKKKKKKKKKEGGFTLTF